MVKPKEEGNNMHAPIPKEVQEVLGKFKNIDRTPATFPPKGLLVIR